VGAARAAGQDRRFGRLDGGDVDAGVVLAQDAARAVDGVRRADGVDERVDVAVRLPPDLLAQRQVARDRVGVAELVAPPVAGCWLSRPAVAIISLISASVMRLLSLGTSVMCAPNACIVTRFSSLNASEKTISRS